MYSSDPTTHAFEYYISWDSLSYTLRYVIFQNNQNISKNSTD